MLSLVLPILQLLRFYDSVLSYPEDWFPWSTYSNQVPFASTYKPELSFSELRALAPPTPGWDGLPKARGSSVPVS